MNKKFNFNKNKATYSKKEIVKSYDNRLLTFTEEKIMSLIKNTLSGSKILDVGVGTGRTTESFSRKTEYYLGIDYSNKMIKKCKSKFGGKKNLHFQVLDIRDLKGIEDSFFDIVLFSYNGLDSVDFDDRKKSIKEINRVLKKGGIFIFSTHNIKNIPLMFKLYSGLNPHIHYNRIIKIIKLLRYNGVPWKYRRSEYAYFIDSAHNFSLNTVYIDPKFQLSQLNLFGFNKTQLFSSISGKELRKENLKSYEEPWIYFLCKKAYDLNEKT